MENLPNFIKLPSQGSFITLKVNQRGKIDLPPKSKEMVIVPGGKKNFDLYRTFAYQCRNIPYYLYRENVEIEVKNRPRPIRIDALLIVKENFFILDTILKASDVPKSRRYCNDVILSCSEINNIILIVERNIKVIIDPQKWIKPIHIVEIRK